MAEPQREKIKAILTAYKVPQRERNKKGPLDGEAPIVSSINLKLDDNLIMIQL